MSNALSHHEKHSQGDLSDRRRARIAFAAYKLLDPRERRDLYERVQLSYPIDREEIEQASIFAQGDGLIASPKTLELSSQPLFAKASEKPSIVLLMQQPLIDQAFDEPDNELYIDAEIVAEEDDQQARINERRGIVRLIRELDRTEPRSQSTLEWIRSRLGI